VLPVALHRGLDALPAYLQTVQAVDFHDAHKLVEVVRKLPADPGHTGATSGRIETVPYAEPQFLQAHMKFLEQPLSEVLIMSYTGETTEGTLLGFQQLRLGIRVRLLVRDWRAEKRDEASYNETHPDRLGDWQKSCHIQRCAQMLKQRPWAKGGGGSIELQQRFYNDPPVTKMILYIREDEPIGGFFGFYKYDPKMVLRNPSIYIDVGCPLILTDNRVMLRYLQQEYSDRWENALPLDALVGNDRQ